MPPGAPVCRPRNPRRAPVSGRSLWPLGPSSRPGPAPPAPGQGAFAPLTSGARPGSGGLFGRCLLGCCLLGRCLLCCCFLSWSLLGCCLLGGSLFRRGLLGCTRRRFRRTTQQGRDLLGHIFEVGDTHGVELVPDFVPHHG